MDQVQAAIGKATGEQGGQGIDLKDAAAKGLEGVKAQVAEGLAGSSGGGAGGADGAAGAGGGEADKAGVNTDELKAAATAYAKGEGGVDEVKKAATDTATSFAQGLMK